MGDVIRECGDLKDEDLFREMIPCEDIVRCINCGVYLDITMDFYKDGKCFECTT